MKRHQKGFCLFSSTTSPRIYSRVDKGACRPCMHSALPETKDVRVLAQSTTGLASRVFLKEAR